MNKQEYLRLLKQQMNHLDQDKSLKIMTEVMHTFDQKAAKGYNEREIIEQLGNPSKLISSYQESDEMPVNDDVMDDVFDKRDPLAKSVSSADPQFSESEEAPQQVSNISIDRSNTGAILRFLLGLMIGLPLLLVLFSIVLAGIAAAVFMFLQGLIMTFDLPYRIWQLPFSIREDFSLLVGIGLIMLGSGLASLFISALRGIFHGFKSLIKGNFRSVQ
jgi:uncharacterized membrane protein